jgi:hypothetical protein
LESVGGEVSDGAGVIGDSTGITITRSITTAGITPAAERSTTEAVLPGLEACGAEVSTAEGQGRSTETGKRPGDTRHHTARAAYDRVPSAATAMADRQGASRHAGAPVLVAEARVAEADLMAEADGGN